MRDYLITNSNFGSEGMRSFAVIEVDEQLNLVRMIEKPKISRDSHPASSKRARE